jgi:hypothetical protein
VPTYPPQQWCRTVKTEQNCPDFLYRPGLFFAGMTRENGRVLAKDTIILLCVDFLNACCYNDSSK